MKKKELCTAEQKEQQTAREQQMQAKAIPKPVFITRAPGMPFEEFKKVCIQRFREAGLIKD